MNYKSHKKLFETRKKDENSNIFQCVNLALEYFPTGLNFLKQYYYNELNLLADGYEVEGISFLEHAIIDWEKGVILLSEGVHLESRDKVIEGNLLIGNVIRMLSYSHSSLSLDSYTLAKQDDELAVFFQMSFSYSYWIHMDFYIKGNN